MSVPIIPSPSTLYAKQITTQRLEIQAGFRILTATWGMLSAPNARRCRASPLCYDPAPVRYVLRTLMVWALGGMLLGGVCLALLPRFVNLDRHRTAVLERLNQRLPFPLEVRESRLAFLPYPGLYLENITFSPFLTADHAHLRIRLTDLFSPPRPVTLEIAEPKVRIQPDSFTRPEIWTFVAPLSSKGFKLEKVVLEDAVLELPSADDQPLLLQPAEVRLSSEEGGLRIKASFASNATTPIGLALAACERSSKASQEGIQFVAAPGGLSEVEWRIGSSVWKGSMSWKGDLDLASPRWTLQGRIPKLACRSRRESDITLRTQRENR